jgi:hypothetical protein
VTHFEDFDRRKAEGAARAEEAARSSRGEGWDASLDPSGRFPVPDEERRLREALFGLNRTLPANYLELVNAPVPPLEEGGRERLAIMQLARVRDVVWQLGVDLYGWSE